MFKTFLQLQKIETCQTHTGLKGQSILLFTYCKSHAQHINLPHLSFIEVRECFTPQDKLLLI